MTIKIVTLNIWLGGLLMEDVIAFIEAENPDILLLQEVLNGEDPALELQHRTMQVLQAKLGFPYENFAPEYLEIDETGGKAQVGNAVLSKLPITSSHIKEFIPYTEEYHNVDGNYQNCPYNLQHVVLDTAVGEVNVFNIHGVWDLDGDSFSPLRQKMSNIVLDAIEGKPNVILAGDTNAKPTNQAMLAVSEKLHSVFGQELKTTFNMRRKDNPGYATAAVDMMFVSPAIKVITHNCPDIDISDHLPLTATLEIPEA